MSQNLLICADATPEIGVGHIMRCLALAEAWGDQGGRVWFLTAAIPEAIRARVQAESFAVVSVNQSEAPPFIIEVADRLEAHHIILDGRQFSAEYQRQIREAGLRLLVVDDYGHAAHYYADCVLNSDLVSDATYVNREPHTRLLLGPQYALLRKEFTQTARRQRSGQGEGPRVLITMGGSDPENMTLVAMEAIHQMQRPNLHFRVIVGAANPRFNVLRGLATDAPGRVELLNDASDMPAQMQWADIAVGATGVTLWELLHMGKAVICWPRSPADMRLVTQLADRGAVYPLEQSADSIAIAAAIGHLVADTEMRGSLQTVGQKLVDGEGARRVVDVFSKLQTEELGEVRSL